MVLYFQGHSWSHEGQQYYLKHVMNDNYGLKKRQNMCFNLVFIGIIVDQIKQQKLICMVHKPRKLNEWNSMLWLSNGKNKPVKTEYVI